MRQPPVEREISFENRALKIDGQSTALFTSLTIFIALLVFQIYEIADAKSWFLTIPKILTALLLLLLVIGMGAALIWTLRSYRIPMKLKPKDDDAFAELSHADFVERVHETNMQLEAELSLQQKARNQKTA